MSKKVYDLIGIGIGPFNLGLAALCHCIPDLHCLFMDQNDAFNWHPGMMIEGTRLQVPFYADLVTLADPCNPFSYLSFLKAKGKMFRFAIAEKYFIRRKEYNEYCQWVVGQLSSLQFSTACQQITKRKDLFNVKTNKGNYQARHIIIGIGTVPYIPAGLETNDDSVIHSSTYLTHKERLISFESISLIGSGQSAAEIFYDLLHCYKGKLRWFTRSERFFPMDYSKLSLEMSTPDYIDHFYSLAENTKREVLKRQDVLYKGINQGLINEIYDLLSELDSPIISLHPNCEIRRITEGVTLEFYHREIQETFLHQTDASILATGYRADKPSFLTPIKHLLGITKRNYSIDSNNSIFVQNAELPTHGFNAADLSLGPYRNATIINSILGTPQYSIEAQVTFQTFGLLS